MDNVPPVYTQFDITPGGPVPTDSSDATRGNGEQASLLREIVALQKKTCDLLGELLAQVSQQQRQRAAELKAWKEAHPDLAKACRQAAESLSSVHTRFLASVAEEAAENADAFSESEYALGEFIDRHGPRLAHFNGVLQLFAQLGSPPPGEPPRSG